MLMHFATSFLVGFLITCLMWGLNVWSHKNVTAANVRRNPILGRLDSEVTAIELCASFALNFGVATLSIGLFFGYMTMSLSDTEYLNGYVLDKRKVKVNCEHSYSCPPCHQDCSTNSDGSQSCAEICSTCFDHSYDIDWPVTTTVGSHRIRRVDRQGVKQPERWTKIKIGEPATGTNGYKNYLLVSDDKYFVYDYPHLLEKYKDRLQPYPSIFDYYRYNRVRNSTSVNTSWLNEMLNEWLTVNGSVKQINLIYVITYESREYFDAMMAHWKGGKKNDLILFFGMDNDAKKIVWIEGNSYARGMNNRSLITEIQDAVGKPFDRALVEDQLKKIAVGFNRLPAEQFEDRKYNIKIPLWFTLMILILNIGSSIGIHILMRNVDWRIK